LTAWLLELTFIAPNGFLHPQTRIYHKLLGPCFKTSESQQFRQNLHFGTPQARACSFATQLEHETRSFARLIPAALTSFCPSRRKNNAVSAPADWAAVEVLRSPEALSHATRSARNVSAIPYFSTISSLLTLFPKFFSSFLHSTCSLSVSHKYLALEEVYLPFKAAIPNNPTLRKHSYSAAFAKYGSFTLYAS
jgi:hypothetical protein